MNEIFNLFIECIRLIFGDAVAWAVGNGIAYSLLGAITLTLEFLGVTI